MMREPFPTPIRSGSMGQHRVSVLRDHVTCFQLHDRSTGPKVIDLTERRLVLMLKSSKDAQQRLVLSAMIDDYRAGNIAVAWRRGRPVWVSVERATKRGPT